jgi:lipopolysaccharide transport system permease protein
MGRMTAPPEEIRTPTTVVQPRRGWWHLELGELWRYRELGYFLTWRDIIVRYKQTVIGAAWAIVQPLVLMVVFSFVFGRFGGRLAPPAGVPKSVFYFSALLPWSYFAQGLQSSTGSVLGSQSMITRVYFPRLLLPLAGVLPGLLDFFMSFLVLIGLMVAYDVPFTLRLLALAPLLVMAAFTAFGAGTWLSATNALYRDIREGVPFLVQVLLFASPVILPIDRIPRSLWWLFGLNPMTGVVAGFRWAVVGHEAFPWKFVLEGIVVIFALVLGGVIYFRRIEDIIIDVV